MKINIECSSDIYGIRNNLMTLPAYLTSVLERRSNQ